MTKIEKIDNYQAELVENALKENDGYCPCKVGHSSETKCMCEEFRAQEEGDCHCGLYRKIKI